MKSEKVAALKRAELFKTLDEATLAALASRAVERRLARNEVLFVAGEEARGLFVIVTGAVRAYHTGVDGREQVIHVERAVTTIAEVPVFDEGVYPSTVAAEEESMLLFIGKENVRELSLRHPQIALAALKLLASRLRRCAELVETLSLRDVGQRLARLLLLEAQAAGVRNRDGLQLQLTLTNAQLAARVGSVREVVSRALTKLQHDGFVRLENRRLTVLDEAALALYAGEKLKF